MCPWALFIRSVNGPLNSGAHPVLDLDGDLGVMTPDGICRPYSICWRSALSES